MKKLFNIAIPVAVLVFFFSSCKKELVVGNGPLITETRSVANFRGVSYKVPGKINFKIDPVYKVEVIASRNILDALQTDIINGILVIDSRHGVKFRSNEDITVNISAPSADYLGLSGVGEMNVEGDLVTNSLYLTMSGLGNISVQKATVNGRITAGISGSGNINVLAGSAVNEDLEISGSGNIDLLNVTAQRAETHTAGSGNIKVNLSQSLEVHISGSGSVYYRGNATVTTHITGSGNVQHL